MEEEYFNAIRARLCETDSAIQPGKMMSSEAITYRTKVFAFFSRKKKMVFRLGRSFEPETQKFDIRLFNPFKKRPPLYGWFEVSYLHREHWEPLAQKALNHSKTGL